MMASVPFKVLKWDRERKTDINFFLPN